MTEVLHAKASVNKRRRWYQLGEIADDLRVISMIWLVERISFEGFCCTSKNKWIGLPILFLLFYLKLVLVREYDKDFGKYISLAKPEMSVLVICGLCQSLIYRTGLDIFSSIPTLVLFLLCLWSWLSVLHRYFTIYDDGIFGKSLSRQSRLIFQRLAKCVKTSSPSFYREKS